MIRALVFSVTFSFMMTAVFGWGQTGHRVTGWVADKHLNKKAKKEIERILGGQSMAIASTWMDEVRSDSLYDYLADWHWVTIRDGETYEESVKNKNGDIIQAIERIVAELKSKKLSAKQETEWVKILIHLIGDIHQPLHVGGGNDRGGNDVKVMWFRVDSNLHRIWDSDMIDDTKLSYTELAESLEKPSDKKLKQWSASSVRDWAMESVDYRKSVYAYDKGRLGYEYAYKQLPLLRTRLLQAGVRIAAVLNDIYGK
ncbi:MAG TPA: S1/P1 nuclease [Ohtaekwangia sp.]|nr:S1/P1 nuclease [Ohtaekwangia sp.]